MGLLMRLVLDLLEQEGSGGAAVTDTQREARTDLQSTDRK